MPVDVLRVDISMEYHPIAGRGSAAVEWIPLASRDPNLRPFLVALLYARILTAHAETRAKLFQTIDEFSKQNVRDEGRTGFPFPRWMLEVGAGAPPQTIWPWDIHDDAGALTKPKLYQATLRGFQGSNTASYFGIHLKMAFGQERILATASSLLAITSYIESSDQEGCYELALFLWQMNEFYGAPEGVHIGKESEALAFATAAIRSGNLRTP